MNRRYFSLVELLAVITIIVILAGITIPVVMHMSTKGKETKARAEMNAIKLAITQYESTYGTLPYISTTTPTTDTFLHPTFTFSGGRSSDDKAYDAIMEILMYLRPDGADYSSTIKPLGNSKHTRFLDPPAKEVADGRSSNTGDTAAPIKGFYYLDPWGHRYNIALDTNYDGKLTLTPTFLSLPSTASDEVIRAKVAIYSYGNAEDTSDREAFLYSWKNSDE